MIRADAKWPKSKQEYAKMVQRVFTYYTKKEAWEYADCVFKETKKLNSKRRKKCLE